MITVNDKLKLFTKRIIDRQQDAYDEKVEGLENKMVIELAERKKMLERDRARYEDSLLRGIKNERSQRLSNARSERKRRLLLKRKTMIDELLSGVKAYTKEFVETEDYEKYLKNIFVKNRDMMASLGAFTVYVNEKDTKYKDMLLDQCKALDLLCESVEKSDKRILGGVIILKADKTTRLDFSLDSVIEDNRKYMGQLIYDMLEEAGEFSGKQS
ncbi:hypothetical protein EZV73_17405 [Acidaminobacter sp. JC074]|uniref:V-type ATP synthase subunit E n=1 Tax=Acidaminobacter sp. JC074 TaxID=2530199 RepID=UPI001F0EB676|nr:V-type ATP synthase subunit E [Acidaminobacter sp. JC074]MCH4889379.1 hypothetical protein [Acidaminobacter sp. JC074]